MSDPLPEAPSKWLCTDCYFICAEPLSAVSPFDSDDRLSGCPTCKSAETMVQACQFEGCEREATSGIPGLYGYRYFYACHKHSLAGEQ
jgi:hypothetical protein